jgi:hypothetical protein
MQAGRQAGRRASRQGMQANKPASRQAGRQAAGQAGRQASRRAGRQESRQVCPAGKVLLVYTHKLCCFAQCCASHSLPTRHCLSSQPVTAINPPFPCYPFALAYVRHHCHAGVLPVGCAAHPPHGSLGPQVWRTPHHPQVHGQVRRGRSTVRRCVCSAGMDGVGCVEWGGGPGALGQGGDLAG